MVHKKFEAPPITRVHHGDCEHSFQLRHECVSVEFVERKDHVSIAIADKFVAPIFEFFAQGAVVVDFAIENASHVMKEKGLITMSDSLNSQAIVPKRPCVSSMHCLGVWSTVNQGLGDRVESD
jgi:hypothetical protein